MIPFAETSDGVFTGLLAVPQEGHRWVSDWQPSPMGNGDSAGDQEWLIRNDTGGVVNLERYPALRADRTRDLHRRFARLARGNPERQRAAILRFADRFGWLGGPEDRSWLTPPALTDQPGRWAHTTATRRAEPVRLWLEAIPEVATLVELWDLIRGEERGALDRYLSWNRMPPRSVSLQVGWHRGQLIAAPIPLDADFRDRAKIADEATHFGAYRFRRHPKMSTLDAVRLYLHDKVNEKLRGRVSPELRDEGNPRGELLFSPHSLLAAIYLHFARELTGGGHPTAECANPRCRRSFVPRRANHRYCSEGCKSVAGYHRGRQGDNSPNNTPE